MTFLVQNCCTNYMRTRTQECYKEEEFEATFTYLDEDGKSTHTNTHKHKTHTFLEFFRQR